MIPKKLHYIWFWTKEKPEYFQSFLASWKKYCPDYEIIERNEKNYDIKKNPYLYEQYLKKNYAFASDYARFDIIYQEGGIYLDTDVEILQSLDPLLDQKWFTGFQDIFYVWGSIFWAQKWNPILKDILNFYETRKSRIIITYSFEKILKKYWLKKNNNQIHKLWKFTIYPSEYFYPYAFFHSPKEMKITKNTYAIHHFNLNTTRCPKRLLIPTNWCFRILEKCYQFFNKKPHC